MAVHEGIDFIAETGTPILAAASGVVLAAEFQQAYGNMVEIDHGDLMTRYAHASKILVKVGQFVRSGEKIAEVGTTSAAPPGRTFISRSGTRAWRRTRPDSCAAARASRPPGGSVARLSPARGSPSRRERLPGGMMLVA